MKVPTRVAERYATIVLAIYLISSVFGGSAYAASATWNGTTDAQWSVVGNWSGPPASPPGTTETATFNDSGNGNTTISLGGGVTIGTVLFDTASAAAYTIGSTGVGNQTLTLDDNGALTINAAVAQDQLINAALTLGTTSGAGAPTITQNSVTKTLTIAGNILGGGGGGTKTLTITGTGNTTLSGIIANGTATVALTKNGTGTLTLSGRNSYTGAVTLSGGVIKVQDPTALSTTAISIAATGAIQFDGTYPCSTPFTLNGTGVSNDGALRNISGVSKLTGNITLGAPARINSDKNILRHLTGTISLGANMLTVGGAGDVSLFGVISGTGGVTMDGTGMYKPSAANTYTGNTAINGGILFLNVAQAAANGPFGGGAGSLPTGTISFGGGTLQYSVVNTTDYSSKFSTAASQQVKIDVSSQAVTFATALTSAGVTLTLSGATGTLTLNKLLNYTGGVTVNSGNLTLDINTAGGNNVIAATAPLALGGNLNVIGTGGTTVRTQTFAGTTFNPGAATITPTLAAASATADVLAITLGALTRNSGGTANIVFTTGNTTTTNTRIDTSTGAANALVADANGVAYMTFGTSATSIRDWATKDGTVATKIVQAPGGFYTAATATTIAGQSDIGALSPTITGAAGDNPVSTIRFNNASARTLTLNGATSLFSVGGILITDVVAANATTITGTGVIRGPNAGTGDLVVHNWAASSSATISLPIGGTGGLTKAGTGTVILSAANTYTGPTTIGGGTLQIGNGGTIGDLGNTTGTIVNNGTLTFNRSAASVPLTVANNITGYGGLIQNGTGETILTGTCTYRGLTTINAGTLTFGAGSSRKWTSRGNTNNSNRGMDGNGITVNANGTLNIAGSVDIENLYLSNGAVNVLSGGELLNRQSVGNGFFGLCIGANESLGAAYGILNVSGGTVMNINDLVISNGPRFGVGVRGTTIGGVLRVSGGTVNTITLLADKSEITILGGIINTAGGNAPNLNTFEGNNNTGTGASTLNVCGGLFDNGTLGINLNGGTAGAAKVTINVAAGTLYTQALTQGTGQQALLNFNGGTLKVGAASAAFTPTPSATSSFLIFVNGPFGAFTGGAFIDNSNFDITIPTALLAPTGNGVRSIALGTGGVGYYGAPFVTISDSGATVSGTVLYGTTTILTVTPIASVFVGQTITGTGIPAGAIVTAVDSGTGRVTISQNSTAGGPTTLTVKGSGATAYANVVGGEVTQFVVTNPGVGYVGTVTAALAGGLVSGGTAATVGAVTLGANTSGGLTKNNGLGKLTLTGNSTYTGATTINVGTLQIGSGGASGSLSTGAIVNNSALIFNRTDTLTQGTNFGVVSGPGTFTHAGAGGTVIFNSANTYTGVTTISGAAGILWLNDANALPGGTATAGGTSALTFNGGLLGLGASDFTRSLAAAGTVTAANFAGNGGWAAYGADRVVNLGGASGTITWSAANTGFNGAAILYLGSSSATHMVDLQNPLDLTGATRTVQVDNGGADIDAKLSGALSGTSSLTKTGAGTLWISSDITCSAGTLALNAGKLILSGNNSGAVSSMTVAASSIAQFNALNSMPGSGSTVTDSGTVAFGPAFGAANLPAGLQRLATGSTGAVAADNYDAENLDFSAAGLTAASLGAVTNVTYTGTLTPNGTTYRLGGGTGTLTYTQALTGGGNGLTVASGSVVLTNSGNTYGGTTTVSGGTLALAGGNLGAGPLTVTGGILNLGGSTQTVASVNVSGTGVITNGVINSLSYTGNGGTIATVLTGPAVSFTQASGTTTLTGTNTYGGGTAINGGTLVAVASNALGSGAVTLTGGDLTLKNDGDGTSRRESINYGNAVIMNGSRTITVDRFTNPGVGPVNAANKTLQLSTLSIGALTLSVANGAYGYGLEFTGTTTMSGAPTFSVSGGSNADVVQGLYFSGQLTGGFGFTKSGSGTLVLSNTSNNFGAPSTITISGGLVSVPSDSCLGNGVSNIVSLNANGAGIQLAGGGSYAHQINTSVATGVIDVPGGITATLSTSFNGGAANATAFQKTGNGTLAFSGVNNANHTGLWTIGAGAIQINSASDLNAAAANLTVSATGAALQLNSGVTFSKTPGVFTIGGSGISNAGALQSMGASANTVSSLITLGAAPTIGADANASLNINGGFSANNVAVTFNAASGANININNIAINATVNTTMSKIGAGTLTFTTTGTTIVPISVFAGSLTIGGAGYLAGAGLITAYAGGSVNLASSYAGGSRLGGRAVTMYGGDFNMTSAGAAEATGLLTVNAGPAIVNNTTGQTLTLGAATPTRAAGGTALFKGGGAIVIGGAPSYIGQTGANGANNKGIFPWALFDAGSGSGTSFATATSVGAPYTVRALVAGTEILQNTFTTSANVYVDSAQTLAASTTINSLTLTAAGSGVTLNPGVTLTLDSGGLLNLVNSAGISGGFLSSTSNRELVFHVIGDLAIGSAIGGTSGGLTKTGAGTLTLTGNNYFTGQITLNDGSLILSGGNNKVAGNGAGALTLNKSTSILNLGTTSLYAGSLGSAGSVEGSGGTITGTGGTLTLNQASALTFAGSIGGSLNLIKAGAQTLTLSSANTTSGSLSVIGGQITGGFSGLTLIDGGAVPNVTGTITINGALLTIDNTGTKDMTDRVPGNAITINSGGIILKGRAQSNSTESLGAVTASTGFASFNANCGGTGVNSAQLTLASLTRNAGASIILYQGQTSLGQIGNNSRIIVTGGLSGNLAPVNGVVPGVFYMLNTDNYYFTGYAAGLGFGPLGTAGFPNTVASFVGAGPTDNVDGANGTIAASQTVNSFKQGNLTFSNGTTTGGPDLLTIASGMTMVNSVIWGTTVQRGRITSGTSELIMFKRDANVTPDPIVNTVIVDKNGATAVNPSDKVSLVVHSQHLDRGPYVILTAPNQYSGGTFVNAGYYVSGGGNVLAGIELNASAPGIVVIPAGGLTINNNSVVDMVANQGQIDSSNTVTINGGGMLRLMGNNTLANLVFNSIGGSVTVPTVIPYNSNTLGGNNSFAGFGSKTGTLMITGSISSTPSNPSVTPLIDSGFLDLNGQSAFNITVSPLSVYPALQGLQISSIIQNGGITKLGAGVLQLSGVNTFTGGLNINAGAVMASTAAQSIGGAGNTVTLNNNSALWLNTTVGLTSQSVVIPAAGATLGTVGNTRLDAQVVLNGALAVNLTDQQANSTDRTIQIGNTDANTTITGTGSLTITGSPGTFGTAAYLYLANNTSYKNTWSGGTTIGAGGGLRLNANYNMGALNGPLTINAGGTLNLNNFDQTVGNFGGTGGTVINGVGGTKTLTIGYGNTGGGSYAGVIATGTGNINLTKVGTGTIALSGANTYTGATAANGGTLLLDFSASGAPASSIISASSALQIADGTLEIKGKSGGTHTQTFASTTVTVPGTITLTQNGATSLDVNLGALNVASGAGINFVGGTGTAAGARFITTTSAGGDDGMTRLPGGCRWNGTSWASVQNVAGTKYIVPWAGSAADIYTGTGGGTVIVPNTASAEVRILEGGSAGAPNYLAASSTTINSLLMTAGTTASTIKMNQNSANDTLVVGNGSGANGAIRVGSGAQGLTIGESAGQGFLTAGSTAASTLDLITQNSSASQGIVVNSVIQNNAGAGAVTISAGGAGGSVALNGVNTFSGSINIGDGTLEIGGGGKLGNGNYAQPIAIGIGGTLKYNSSSAQTLSGVISGVGGLVKTGAGALELQAINTFEGGTVVNNGNLRLTSNSGVIRGSLTINANGTCTTENGAALAYGVTLPHRTVTINGGTLHKLVAGTGNNDYTLKSIDMTGGLISSSTIGYYEFFNDYGTTIPINIHASASEAVISANMGARNNAGTTTFLFTTDAGGTTPSGVDLLISGHIINNTGSYNVTKAGAGLMALSFDNHNSVVYSTGTLFGYIGTTTISAGTLQLGYNNGSSGSLNPASSIVNNGTLAFKRGDSVLTQGIHFNSVISGTGGVSQLGSGTTFLNGANTYSGVTRVSAGSLNVSSLANGGSASPIGTGTGGAASLVINGGALQYTGGGAQTTDRLFTIGTSGATLEASGGLMTLGSAGGSIAFATNNSPASLTLTGTGSGSLGATLGDSGSNPNITSLTKTGSGTWTLTAANTFSGSTTVSNGKLYLNGANSGTTAISVAGGATLGGTGSASAATVAVAASGTVEAGSDGAGSLTLNGLSLAGSSIVKASDIGNYTNSPAINVTSSGGLTTASSVTVKLSGAAPSGSGVAHILQYSGAIGGAGFAGFNVTLDTSEMTGAGGRAAFTLVNNPPYVDVSYSVDTPVWKGAGDATWITAPNLNPPYSGNWKKASDGTDTSYIANDAPLFDDTASGLTVVNISAADVVPGSVIISNSTLAYTLTGNYAIAGGTPVIKRGTGVLTVSNTNKFSGQLTVENGTLAVSSVGNVSSDGPLGNSALPVILGSSGSATGTLEITSVTSVTNSKPFAMAAGSTGAFQIDSSSVTQTLSGVIDGGGTLRKTGSGTLVLSGANNYGKTAVGSGMLQFSKAVALHNGVAGNWIPANITVDSGAILGLNVGGATDFTVANVATLLDSSHLAASTASTGLKSGSFIAIDTSNAGAGQTLTTAIPNPNGGVNVLGLIKNGAGTLTLSTVNSTYTGGSTVNGGTLSMSGASLRILGSLTINAAGTAIFDLGWGQGQPVSPTRSITINGGTLNSSVGGGNSDYSVSSVTMQGGLWSQTGAGYYDFFQDYGSNLSIITLATNTTATISANLASRNHTTVTFTTAAGTTPSGIDLLVSGQLRADGAYQVIKEGLGVMALTGVSLASTYSGGTRVNAGTFLVDLANRNDLILNTGALTLGGGTFKLKGKGSASSSQLLASLASIAGTSSRIVVDANAGGANTTILTFTSPTITAGIGSSVNFDYTAGTTVGETPGNNYVVLTGSAAGLLGTAFTVTDSGGTGYAKVLAGGIVVRSTTQTPLPASGAVGTMSYNVWQNISDITPGDLNLKQTASQSALSVEVDTKNAAGTLQLQGTVLNLNGLNILSSGAANTFAITATSGGGMRPITSGGTLTIVNSNTNGTGTVTLGAPILDNSASKVTLNGAGTTVLSGESTFGGRLTINAGLAQLGATGTSPNGPLGTAAVGTTVAATGAALDLNGFTPATAESLILNGTGISGSGALYNSSSTSVTNSGPITLGSDTRINSAVLGANLALTGGIAGAGYGLTIGGPGNVTAGTTGISGTGTTLTMDGSGTLTMAAASTYTGATTLKSGAIQIGVANGLPTTTVLTIGDAGTTGKLILGTAGGAYNQQVSGLQVTGLGGSVVGGNASVSTLTVANGSDYTFAGTLGGGGANENSLGLTKSGIAKLTLTAANTYSGNTLVSAGTLALGATGSIANSPVNQIAAGATFDVSAQSYTMSAAQTMVFGVDPAGSGSAGLLKAASLNISNGKVDFAALGTLNDTVYILATYSSLSGSQFATVSNMPAGYGINYSYAGNKIALVQILPPTVTTAAATAIGVTNATLGATITSNGGTTITSYGTTWSVNSSGSNDNMQTVVGAASGAFTLLNVGLPSASNLYAWGWASNAAGIAFTATPKNFYTEPYAASNLTFSGVGPTNMTVTWQNANGAGRVVVMRSGSAVADVPADGSAYAFDADFTNAPPLGSSRVVYSGTANNVAVTGLSIGTVYYVKVFEYAGSGALINYQTINPAAGSQTAANPSTGAGTVFRFQ